MSTVYDFEKARRTVSDDAIAAIRAALEAAGVEFIAENGGGRALGSLRHSRREGLFSDIYICAYLLSVTREKDMSDRKLFGVLSGAQITILGALAIITPGAVYAVTYTSVVITDPVSGKQAFIDAGRRLYTYDPIAGYANSPLNLVQISGSCVINSSKSLFTVPSGKALILKSLNMSYDDGTQNLDNKVYFTTVNKGEYMVTFDNSNASATLQTDFGNGFYIHSGDGFKCHATVEGNFQAYGYYVPAAAVPE